MTGYCKKRYTWRLGGPDQQLLTLTKHRCYQKPSGLLSTSTGRCSQSPPHPPPTYLLYLSFSPLPVF
ncbi:hypothetical protein CDV31_000557 [Fusarium ambrosium]|uniref:Uncharacterized protein n=1 Tax=Fusarium ambrosium TaxID=131363 RepID=A0A428V222_9HYPO|nr:hypothetical protein CDV31_000557 [Fusarium ambrosium]